MDMEQLYEILEIDGPEDVEYFEQMADLMEMDEELTPGMFASVLSCVSPENAGEFAENYISGLTEAIPDGAGGEDIAEVMEAMAQRLMLLAEDLDDPEARDGFSSELYRLREWLHCESGATVDGRPSTLLDAFTAMRAERLGIERHSYGLDIFPDLMPQEMSYSLGRFEKIDM